MIDDIAKNLLNPPLKAQGFKRRGLCWNRKRGDFVDVIVLQKAKFSSPAEEFINGYVAVSVPEFREIIFGTSPSFFIEGDGIFSFRFGELIENEFSGKSLDQWWKLTSEVKSVVEAELYDVVIKKVVPLLDSCSSFNAIQHIVNIKTGGKTKSPYFQINKALLCWKLGEKTKCNEILDAVVQWPEKIELIRNFLK